MSNTVFSQPGDMVESQTVTRTMVAGRKPCVEIPEQEPEPQPLVKDDDMFETLDKLMLAGLGALSMTRERAEKIFDEYVARGQAEKDARTGFVRDLMDASEKTRKDLEKLINDQVERAVKTLDLAGKEDVRRIEEKLDALLKPKK